MIADQLSANGAQQARGLASSQPFLAALSRVTASVESTRNPEQVLNTLGEELLCLGLSCGVVLQDPSDQSLIVRYVSIESRVLRMAENLAGLDLIGHRVPQDVWLVSEVVESSRALYIVDPVEVTMTLVPGVPKAIVRRAAGILGVTSDTPSIYLPLVVDEGVIGVLAIWGEGLQESDVAVLSVFAGQLAGCLESARLFEAEQRHAKELATLLEVNRAVSSTLELEERLLLVAKQMVAAADVDGCTLSRWNQETDSVVTWLEWRRDIEWRHEAGTTYPLAEYPFTRAVLEARQPGTVRVSDPDADPAEVAHMRRLGTKSLLILPLVSGDRVIGLIELDESEIEREFAKQEIRLFQALANQAAVAIENALLYESVIHELQERERAEEALQKAHSELEQRVRERTEDLVVANAALQAEVIERQRMEEQLRESEAKYRQLVQHAPAGIYEIDLMAGKFTEVNDVICAYTDYTRAELLSLSPFDILTEESNAKFLERYAQIAAGESVPENVEYQIVGKSGRVFWVLLNSRFFRDGEQFTATAVVHDITERKQAAQALAESEEKYRRVVENANEAILVVQDGRFKFFNPKTLELTGFSQDELVEGDFASLIHPQDREIVLKRHVRRLKGEQLPDVNTFRVRDREGAVRWVEIRAVQIEWEGRPAILAFLNEITERKRSEQLLQVLDQAALAMERVFSYEEIYAAVAGELEEIGLACMILLTDAVRERLHFGHGSFDSRILRVAEKLVGIRTPEFSLVIDDVDVYREVVRNRKTVLVEGDEIMTQSLPKSAKLLAGRLVKLLDLSKSIAAPLIVQDVVVGVLSVHSDGILESDIPAITAFAHQVASAWRKAQLIGDLEASLEELKQTQSQLVQAQKMEAVGRLAGGVAHDFNNLLTVIQVNAQLLMRKLHPEDPLWDQVKQIQGAGERATGLIRQLLRFSRREIVEPKIVNLNRLVLDLSRMLQRVIGEDIELVTSLDDALWPIEVDPLQMEQVAVNLALNSRDAMPSGGRLFIETSNVVLDGTEIPSLSDVKPGDYVRLTVGDTGVGMDTEVKARIFEPFFTTKEQGQGTGLGLSTVYGIITQHAGHIEVDSELDKGSVFRIYLPRAKDAQVSSEPPLKESMPSAIERGSLTILLVEDEKAVRDLAVYILNEQGYQVLAAKDGADALQICREHPGPIHLLVTDVIMPGMTGEELAERIQIERPDTRILYTSGYSEQMIAQQRVSREDFAFIPKPFTVESLARKAQSVLEKPASE